MITMITPDNITTITSSLTIPDLETRDGRDYKCIYSNSEGETSSYIASLTIGVHMVKKWRNTYYWIIT